MSLSLKFIVTIHNGLSKELRSFARIPVEGKSYSVTDPEGNEIKPQVIEYSSIMTQMLANFSYLFEFRLSKLSHPLNCPILRAGLRTK